MYLTTALNLFWALIGVFALCLFLAAERRRSAVCAARGRVRRLCAVVVVILSLFPCVSASDDVLGLSYLRTDRTSGNSHNTSFPDSGKEKSAIQLAHLLQSLENLQICAFYALLCSFSFFCLVFLSRPKTYNQQSCPTRCEPGVVATNRRNLSTLKI